MIQIMTPTHPTTMMYLVDRGGVDVSVAGGEGAEDGAPQLIRVLYLVRPEPHGRHPQAVPEAHGARSHVVKASPEKCEMSSRCLQTFLLSSDFREFSAAQHFIQQFPKPAGKTFALSIVEPYIQCQEINLQI